MIANDKYSLCLALALVFCVATYVQGAKVGGLDDEKPADETVRKVISLVQEEIRKQYPKEIETIEPIGYKTQIVAGMNYYIRALVTEKGGNKSHAHLRVWRSFKGAHELTAIKTDVDSKSELKYFQ